MTRTRTAALAVTALALAGCASSHPHTDHVAACKAAMTRDYDYARAHPDAPPATRPAACKGVSDAALQKIAGEIMAGNTATATP